MNKAVTFSAVAALAASAGIALAATSSNAAPPCPKPLHGSHHVVVVVVTDCAPEIGPIFPGCDPGPCDPTAAAPRE